MGAPCPRETHKPSGVCGLLKLLVQVTSIGCCIGGLVIILSENVCYRTVHGHVIADAGDSALEKNSETMSWVQVKRDCGTAYRKVLSKFAFWATTGSTTWYEGVLREHITPVTSDGRPAQLRSLPFAVDDSDTVHGLITDPIAIHANDVCWRSRRGEF